MNAGKPENSRTSALRVMAASLALLSLLGVFTVLSQAGSSSAAGKEQEMAFESEKTEAEWRRILTPEQYRVMRQKGTEAPFCGTFTKHKEAGTYTCAACGNKLFASKAKFESGTGWPSYFEPASTNSLLTQTDTSHGMIRTEVLCARCGSHLGHVFNDGPPPSGKRYCINSVALEFTPKE